MSSSLVIKRLFRRALTPAARAVRRRVLPSLFPRRSHAFPERMRHLRIVGLLSSASGIGKSARLCMDVLQGAGYKVSGADVAGLFDSDDAIPFSPSRSVAGPAQVSIYHLNPPMLLPGIIRSNPLPFWQGYNIGYWAWELEELPPEWIAAIQFMDAIMVPSTFCRAAVERHTSKPVLVVPHPVTAEPQHGRRIEAAADGGERFRVLGIFNFGSSFERKNPIAAVRAFRKAFLEDPHAELVLKVSDGHRYPADKARLEAEIGSSSNIRLIDEVWEAGRLGELLGSVDAYISLHRSEGFGLTLAEAIHAGVPVVATNWSGNTDFCSPDLCFPVDYELVPVKDQHSSFAGIGTARWAEPSLEHAAVQLRRVRADRAAARTAALQLREQLRAYLRSSTYEMALSRLAEDERGRAAAPAVRGDDALRASR